MKAYPSETRAEVMRLRNQGVGYNRIARLTGIPKSTVVRWANPAYAERQRQKSRELKKRYRGTCIDCGTSTAYNGYDTYGSERCDPCFRAFQHTPEYSRLRQYWTAERIIARIQEWAVLHGEPPAQPDWGPWTARHVLHDETRAQRWEQADGYWPWFTIVHTRFGSWNAALAAAGFEPRAPHGGGSNVQRRRNVAA